MPPAAASIGERKRSGDTPAPPAGGLRPPAPPAEAATSPGSPWRLIDHALLYAVYTGPGCWIGACQADILAAIGKARETFVGDACTLIKSIGTGMAETTVNHVPTMQACTPGKCIIPNKWIETPNGTIMVDQRKKLLS